MSNDGTTATQVSPIVPESEMSTVRAIFDKAANAIVQASELAVQVNELTATVATIKADFEKSTNDLKIEVEHVRSQNRWLDEQLASVRKARDEAQAEAMTAKANYATLTNNFHNAEGLIKEQADTIDKLRETIATLTRERDDYASMSQSYSDDLDKAKATLAGIKEKLGWVEPKPEPVPAVVPANALEPTTQALPISASPPVQPVHSASSIVPEAPIPATNTAPTSNPAPEPGKNW